MVQERDGLWFKNSPGGPISARGKQLYGSLNISAAFDKKEKALEKTWGTRLDAQMSTTPKFETVFREVRAALRHVRLFDLVLEAHNTLG
jgi:hypothetical protein